MGAGRAKAFLPLAGRALLLRAAEAFEAAPEVEAIVAVVPAGEQRAAHDLRWAELLLASAVEKA